MDRNLLKKIIKEIGIKSRYTKEQEEQVEYIVRVLLFEVVKIILLLVLFLITGYIKEGFVVLVCMILTKPFIGGYHEKTQIKCFFSTLIITSMIIILSVRCELDFFSIIILNLFSIFIVYNRAPILDSNMPITRVDLINKNRKIGISITVFLTLLSIGIFNLGQYSEIIVWTMLVDASLMFNKRNIN